MFGIKPTLFREFNEAIRVEQNGAPMLRLRRYRMRWLVEQIAVNNPAPPAFPWELQYEILAGPFWSKKRARVYLEIQKAVTGFKEI